MKKVDLKEFVGIVAENENLKKEIKSLTGPDLSEMKRIAAEYGFELSLDRGTAGKDVVELSHDDLEHVAGGRESNYGTVICKMLVNIGVLDPDLCD